MRCSRLSKQLVETSSWWYPPPKTLSWESDPPPQVHPHPRTVSRCPPPLQPHPSSSTHLPPRTHRPAEAPAATLPPDRRGYSSLRSPFCRQRLRGWLCLSHTISGLFSFPDPNNTARLQLPARQPSSYLLGLVLPHQEGGREEESVLSGG